MECKQSVRGCSRVDGARGDRFQDRGQLLAHALIGVEARAKPLVHKGPTCALLLQMTAHDEVTRSDLCGAVFLQRVPNLGESVTGA